MTYAGPLDLLQHNASDVATRLRILANRDRLIMLCRMSAGEVSVNELVELTGLAQPTVSQHLALLREAGAVEVRPSAQTRYYHIVDDMVAAIIDALCSVCAPDEQAA